MRKTVFLMLCAATLAAVSCQNFQEENIQKKEFVQEQTATPQYFIKAVMETPTGTKTSLEENLVLWTAGDAVKVFNASNPAGVEYTLSSGAGTTSAVFASGEEITGAGPFYAVYPASAAGTLTGSSVSVTLPQVQVLTSESFGNGANLAFAKTDDLAASFQFKNALGGVSFTLSGEASVKSLRVQAKGTEALWGGGTLTMDEGIPVLAMDPADTDHQAIYLSGTAQSGPFCLMLPPGTLSSGFMAQFTNSEDMAMIKSAGASVNNTVVRNHFVAMPAFAFTAQVKAAFLEPASFSFGQFENVGTTDALSAFTFNKATCQYAYRTVVDDSRFVRLQSLPQGKLFSAQVPYGMALGASSDNIEVSSLSGSDYASGTAAYRLVKSTNEGAWYVSADGQKGFILLLED